MGCDSPGPWQLWPYTKLGLPPNLVVTLLNPHVPSISSSWRSTERQRSGELKKLLERLDGQFFLILMGARYPKPVAMVALKIEDVMIK